MFGPLGRMALTNYVSATLLMLAGGALLDLSYTQILGGLMLGMTGGILILRGVGSAPWLHR